MINKDGGGGNFKILWGNTAVMRGDIELIRDPPVPPPLGKPCPKRKSDFSTIWLNKNDNKKQTSRSFSILFSVMGSLEIVMESLEIFLDFCCALSRNCQKH